ncbi:MAG: hypothetical protein II917_07580 [Synergistaceae bacterium]|nr:hypothetical protein [Synergistaceae bacterium]
MRKKFVVIIMFLLTFSGSAFALNDREYYDMKKDPFFRASDKKLTKIIEELKIYLSDKDFNDLKARHKEWIDSGLDKVAETLIENNKLAKVDAYVKATEGRIKYLESIKRKYTHEPEPEPEIVPERPIAESQESQPEPQTQNQTQTQITEPKRKTESKKLTQKQAQELLERELKERGLWQRNNVIVAGADSEANSEGGEILTLYDEQNNKNEDCWHFIHGEDFPDYISAINDYYVSMNDGAIYVLDTFEDVVRPIDEVEL